MTNVTKVIAAFLVFVPRLKGRKNNASLVTKMCGIETLNRVYMNSLGVYTIVP